MEVEYSPKAIEDIKFWKKSGQTRIQKKLPLLLLKLKERLIQAQGSPKL